MKRVIVIGGGPSGIVSAIFAKRNNNEVIVLEKNSTPLKKLLMTGNGKCNYLNEYYDENCYHTMNKDYISKIITSNNIQDVLSFFDKMGIIPKIKNGYYYPFSNQASTIQKALIWEAEQCGVIIEKNQCVKKIEKKDNTFMISTEEKIWTADYIVLACGSKAYPKTGSDGAGYDFLERFHHTIIKPLPALVQLIGKGKYYKEWDGVRCDAVLDLYEDELLIASEKGELQLTDYGISGICTFNLSHFVTRGLDLHKKEIIKINFVPFIKEDISNWIDNYSRKNSNKTIKGLLEGFLNYKLVSVILSVCHIKENSYFKELSQEEKDVLINHLKSFPVEIVSTKDFSSCQICNGGVKLNEINPNTMESFIVPNLYVVGELLDLNGNCGGYNLTLCWISGMLAGKNIGDRND